MSLYDVPPQPAERTRPVSGSFPGLRSPRLSDGPSIWALAGACGLDLNSQYAYALWAEYFADTSLVAVDDHGHVVGFVNGFRVPRHPSTVFVWQVAVAESHRRRHLAGRMLDELIVRTRAHIIEATVTPSNAASIALFRSLGERHGGNVDEAPLLGEELLPPGHEREVRLQVLVGGTRKPKRQ